MSNDALENKTRSYWDFKGWKEYEWFRALVLILGSMVVVYLLLHFLVDQVWKCKHDYEYAKLDAQQMQQVNRIYFDSIYIKAALYEKTSTNDTTNSETDTSLTIYTPPSNSTACTRVVRYLNNEFSFKIDSAQIDSLRVYLCSASPLEATGFLNNVRLRVESSFWLVGPSVYFEIIFWSWFGVLASLLFNLGVVGRNSTTNENNPQSVFDSSEIPYQFAKLLYAPLCTLVIVFGYNFFSNQNLVDISSSKGVIVFAFIGGFYSSRLISFLDRLKEVVLPNSGTAELPGKSTTPTAITTLKNLVIELEPDETSIEEDLINDIAEVGLGDATVTLQNEQGEAIQATKTGEDPSAEFVVETIKPGKYIIKATWSKLVNDEVVNLAAEQTVDIKNTDKSIVLLMKKSESND